MCMCNLQALPGAITTATPGTLSSWADRTNGAMPATSPIVRPIAVLSNCDIQRRSRATPHAAPACSLIAFATMVDAVQEKEVVAVQEKELLLAETTAYKACDQKILSHSAGTVRQRLRVR